MELRLEYVSRRPTWPLGAILLGLLWVCLGTAVTYLAARAEWEPTLCLFKRLVGVPCLTCGSTRAVLRLFNGDVLGAWCFNPLVFSLVVLGILELLARVGFCRTFRLRLSPRERRVVWCLAGLVLLVNWVYVIMFVG